MEVGFSGPFTERVAESWLKLFAEFGEGGFPFRRRRDGDEKAEFHGRTDAGCLEVRRQVGQGKNKAGLRRPFRFLPKLF